MAAFGEITFLVYGFFIFCFYIFVIVSPKPGSRLRSIN
ncbi:hypothetical protein LEP1GSC107_2880 [Leptospira interrogans serovar Grippotyphosa str. UI 12769]|uniref:Uncharacterized protein n=1 Tax=Leptospira interrogans serovar Hardjo str. Norma TaxID=1279460 RepID=A0A0M3TL84_LEPIR|nr:hypothetical protein G436_1444 [Leptospira interrogans serovar Hardjo str. Norma]EKO95779.1 hypothetical protein LEP1GSC057_0915 [Leptospira interrogans str. Brem 329]EKR45108.1 hypothetical protein LEP1GSC097_3276 [Leptospira interrogans serovar Grippotyphosa str. UI 08368]EMN86122.1 hypothetical protein LEP1GSC107_2880 [Leptospira interrogans serovar Grippotyphosa str. UI 12769]